VSDIEVTREDREAAARACDPEGMKIPSAAQRLFAYAGIDQAWPSAARNAEAIAKARVDERAACLGVIRRLLAPENASDARIGLTVDVDFIKAAIELVESGEHRK
jgi:hypothetical protein